MAGIARAPGRVEGVGEHLEGVVEGARRIDTLPGLGRDRGAGEEFEDFRRPLVEAGGQPGLRERVAYFVHLPDPARRVEGKPGHHPVHGRECGGFVNGQISEYLAIHFNTGQRQAIDKAE